MQWPWRSFRDPWPSVNGICSGKKTMIHAGESPSICCSSAHLVFSKQELVIHWYYIFRSLVHPQMIPISCTICFGSFKIMGWFRFIRRFSICGKMQIIYHSVRWKKYTTAKHTHIYIYVYLCIGEQKQKKHTLHPNIPKRTVARLAIFCSTPFQVATWNVFPWA